MMISRSRILIVDNGHAMALLAKYYLEKFGFCSITVANNSKWALEEVINVAETADRYDLIICDYKMNLCCGVEILKELRQSEEIEYTKFLMMIPSEDEMAKSRSLKAGADICLMKPFAEVDLIETIVEIFKEEDLAPKCHPMVCFDASRKSNG